MKKFITLTLALIMLFSLSVLGASAASPEDFSDIPDDWSREGIISAIENDLLNGTDGKILPNDNLTRAQLAAIINRSVKATSTADISSFIDVPEDAWFYSDIAKAVKMGTFGGTGNRMRPNDPITREETFVVLARAFLFPKDGSASLYSFADASSVSEWAVSAVAALVSEDYVQGGSGNRINPKSNISRAEFATIMLRLVNLYISEAGEVTDIGSAENIMINVPDVTLDGVTVDGNIYIGDGVGDGDVTLKDVTCTGRLVIRGGGEETVRITGTTNIGKVIISRKDGKIRVTTEEGAEIEVIYVEGGSDDVIFEGTVGSIEVNAADVTVIARNAEIVSAVVNGERSQIIVEQGSAITTVNANAAGVKISGDGTVEKVIKTVEDVEVSTPDTEVISNIPEPPIVDDDDKVKDDGPKSGMGVGGGTTKSYALTGIIFNDDPDCGEVSIDNVNNEIGIDFSALTGDVEMSTVRFITENDTTCSVGKLGMTLNTNVDLEIITIIQDMFTAVGRPAPASFDDTTMHEIRLLFDLAYSVYEVDSSIFDQYGIEMVDATTAKLTGKNNGENKTFSMTLTVWSE